MRKPKAYILLIATLFVLFGSIGVNVFLHTCEEDGTFVSFFTPTEEADHCGDAHEEIPPCCESDAPAEKDDCCDDEIKYYKFKLDYFQKISTPFIPLNHVPQPVVMDVPAWTNRTFETASYANPPPLPRKTYRSLIQIWTV
jgi:hypothetical protein